VKTVKSQIRCLPLSDYGIVPGSYLYFLMLKPDERLGPIYRVEVALEYRRQMPSIKPSNLSQTADIIIRRRRIADILLDVRQMQKGGIDLKLNLVRSDTGSHGFHFKKKRESEHYDSANSLFPNTNVDKKN